MVAWRLEISFRVLKNIARGSALFIIIININEMPHHFTFILFLVAKVAITHNSLSPIPTFVLLLIVCVLNIESLTITRLFLITAVWCNYDSISTLLAIELPVGLW